MDLDRSRAGVPGALEDFGSRFVCQFNVKFRVDLEVIGGGQVVVLGGENGRVAAPTTVAKTNATCSVSFFKRWDQSFSLRNRLLIAPGANEYGRTGGGVLRRVIEQVEQYLLEQHRIERHHRHIGRQVELHVVVPARS